MSDRSEFEYSTSDVLVWGAGGAAWARAWARARARVGALAPSGGCFGFPTLFFSTVILFGGMLK